jgi:hypothetical protein
MIRVQKLSNKDAEEREKREKGTEGLNRGVKYWG